jgi:hypothetical protein
LKGKYFTQKELEDMGWQKTASPASQDSQNPQKFLFKDGRQIFFF